MLQGDATLKLVNSKPVSHTKFRWLSTASLPCHRIVAFTSEQSFATPLHLAVAPLSSTSLGVVGVRWPWMRRKHHMLDSLANCVRERTERAKNRNGHFIRTDRNGSCTLIEPEQNGNGHSVAQTGYGNFLWTPTVYAYMHAGGGGGGGGGWEGHSSHFAAVFETCLFAFLCEQSPLCSLAACLVTISCTFANDLRMLYVNYHVNKLQYSLRSRN